MGPNEVIRIMCPNLGCQRILAVPDRARGRVVRCRGCGTNIRVPMPADAPLDSETSAVAGEKPSKSKRAG